MISLRVLFFVTLVVRGLASDYNVDIIPLEAVRRIGDQLTVLCKVSFPIDSCRMTVGGASYRLMPDYQKGDVVYVGQGFKAGECGVLIKNIKEELNGNISCIVPSQPLGINEVVGTMRLIVARAPGEPTLFTTSHPTFREGDKFMAQCVVPNGRPAAKITWFLGEEELLHGLNQSVLKSKPGSDRQTISQSVSWTLTDQDDTKILVCRAEHEALEKPMETRRRLTVQYSPKRQKSGPITIFGLKLGAEGRLNVTVRANPKPSAEWTSGYEALAAPSQSYDGHFTAVEPLLLGNGYYNITLILARITKDDVDRTYYLRVDNGLGREEFAVRISTMDEPAEADNKASDDSSGADNKASDDSPGADNKANDKSIVPVVPIVVSAVVLGVAVGVILGVLVTLRVRKCRRVKSNTEELPQTYVPDNPFYVNLLFRRECQQEIYEREHQYEEIN